MLQLNWTTLSLALIGTFVLGLVMNRLWLRIKKKDHQGMAQQLDDLKLQHQNYQVHVTEHFNRTSELINTLNRNYQDVRDHLQRGADELVMPDFRLENKSKSDDLSDLTPAKQSAEEEPEVPPKAEHSQDEDSKPNAAEKTTPVAADIAADVRAESAARHHAKGSQDEPESATPSNSDSPTTQP